MITSATGLPGTNGYRPPEYMDSKYSILSDIYSLGVVSAPASNVFSLNVHTEQYSARLLNKVMFTYMYVKISGCT